MNAFDRAVASATRTDGLYGLDIRVIQVNVGLKCNLACSHCHVVSSPWRTEAMDWETMQWVLRAARKVGPCTVDLTGGAPELNPHFRDFVTALRADGHEVLVRTNLTVLLEPGMADLPAFFRDQRVHLVASLPCYLEENVDRQRGDGVFRASLEAIRRLNEMGYGRNPDLPLDLVYNPVGPQLPPPQAKLEQDYRRFLGESYGIAFTRLITITNMPIGRFLGDLRKQGKDRAYMDLLQDRFNPATLEGLMCRHQISVRWDGILFDCDFNLALRMPILIDGKPVHIRDFDPERLARRRIMTAGHCFGCTAGCGSSCGGALVETEEQREVPVQVVV